MTIIRRLSGWLILWLARQVRDFHEAPVMSERLVALVKLAGAAAAGAIVLFGAWLAVKTIPLAILVMQ